ncbi:MAG: IgGFc-binding protein [Deltaproteobacteria bacterium]|nr:IgGFc-binding protein [Deltaproteobacteria bacterium]
MDVRRWAWAAMLLAGAAAGCGSESDEADGRDGRDYGGDAECTDGEHRCVGDSVAEVCSGGHWGGGVPCAERGQVCERDFGCVLCHPDMTRCEGDDVMVCAEDGGSWVYGSTCDRAAGETCDPVSGVCINLCARAASARSNIGCEYWAVDLDNAENNMDWAAAAQFAVVVANLSDTYQSEVVIDRDLAMPGESHELEEVERATLDPGDLWIFRLPRWDVDGEAPEHRDTDPQTTLSRRVYHVTSTTPVVAYQFNTLDQVYSNAASVLLPTTALDTEYYGVLWDPSAPIRLAGISDGNRDYVTIVGVEDGTEVTVVPTYDIMAGVGQLEAGILPVDGVPAGEPTIPAGTEAVFTLDRFDVLNLETVLVRSLGAGVPDLTGTTVRSSLPVAVFFGIDLAVVGNEVLPGDPTPEDPDNCCAEHMEQQVPPTSALGQNFVVSRSPIRSSDSIYWVEYDYYRILAVRDGTHVTTTADEARDFTLDAGEWLQFKSREGFVVHSEPTPVIVAQYIVSQEQCYEWRATAGGDSDMVYIPPVEQRRNTYIFATGEGFSENWAVVSIPEGVTATIDGRDVETDCRPSYTDGDLDGVTYRAYHCPIEDGRHDVTSTGGVVGVMVFGYYAVGSYQYPAGSEMRRIFFG